MAVYNNQQAESLFDDELNHGSAPDFMSALDKVCDEVVLLHQKPDGMRNNDKNKIRRVNRNISSIVEKIRDEGAAFDEESAEKEQGFISGTIKELAPHRERKKKLTVQKVRPQKTVQQTVRRVSSDAVNHPCEQKKQQKISSMKPVVTEKTGQRTEKNNALLLYSVIILSVMLVSGCGFAFYQIQQQTRIIKQTLVSYKKEMAAGQKKLDAVRRVKGDMRAVNQKLLQLNDALLHIKAANNNNATLPARIPAHGESSVSDNHAGENIAVSRQKTALTGVATNKLSTAKPVARTVGLNTPVQQKLLTMYAVNLVAFSDKRTALQQMNQLKAAGLLAVLKAVHVNGKKLYRLSIDGFSTRDEASDYVRKVKRKYGFNGWVQQSQVSVSS